MKLQAIVPMMWVTDIPATVAFYRDVLGFKCLNQMDHWAVLERDEVELMLSLPNVHETFERPVFTGSFYFECDEIDELWESMKERVRVVYPIEDFEYGMREFAIRDVNGYILQFGKPIE